MLYLYIPLIRQELCDSLAIFKAINMAVVNFQGKYFHLSTQQMGYEITLNANKGFNRHPCHGSFQMFHGVQHVMGIFQ